VTWYDRQLVKPEDQRGRRLVNPPYPWRSSATTRTEVGSLTTLNRLRRVIAGVPRGKVVTYGQVAERAGMPGAARVTVWALQHGDGLPWHRVVAAGGRIALTGEEGREQRLRLQLEGVKFQGGRVRMDLHLWTPRRRSGRRPPRRRSGTDRSPRAGGRSRARRPDTVEYGSGFGPRSKPLRHDRWTETSEEPYDP